MTRDLARAAHVLNRLRDELAGVEKALRELKPGASANVVNELNKGGLRLKTRIARLERTLR